MVKMHVPAKIYRAGRTARYWNYERNGVDVATGDTLDMEFHIASKGGGDTAIRVKLEPAVFPAIIKAMSRTDAGVTLEAIGAAMEEIVAEQVRSRERAVLAAKKAAHGELVDEARSEYYEDTDNSETSHTFHWLLHRSGRYD